MTNGDWEWILAQLWGPCTFLRQKNLFLYLLCLRSCFLAVLLMILDPEPGAEASLAVKETYLERYSLQVCLFQHFAASAFYSNLLYLERLTDPILHHWRPSEVWRPVSLSESVLPVESSQLAAVLVHFPGLKFSPSKRLQSQDPFFCFYTPDVLLGDISHLALKGSADLVIFLRFNAITGLHNYSKNLVFSRFNTWIWIKRQKLQ